MSSEEWPTVRLGDLIEIKHGYAFKGADFTDDPTGDVLVTPGNFRVGGGWQDGKRKYHRGLVDPAYVLAPGDLIVTMTDLSKQGDTLGFPAVVPSTSGTRLLHNQRIGRVRVKDETRLLDRFLYYVLCTAPYRHEVLATATGSTVRHTSPTRIYGFEFSLPPLPEQRAIAEVLGALDDKIELNEQMNATLDEMARALFKSWFVDYDPVRAKSEGRQPSHMNAAAAALFPDSFEDSALGPIPAGWRIESLDSIADFLNGLALQKFPPEDDDYLPVIKIAEMRRGYTSTTGKASANLNPKYVVDDGDMLFSWSGSLEVRLWTHGSGALNQHLFKVTSQDYPRWFFYHWTRQHLPEFQAIAAGKATTMGHIQRHHLTDALVAVPSAPAIDAGTYALEPLLELQVRNGVESRTLVELRDALLPRLISGEMRVGDAARAVEVAV